jgi:hypothetical protein
VIVVVQCAAKKRDDAGLIQTADRTPVFFVADPSSAPISNARRYARPDDIYSDGQTWRDRLLEYNLRPGENPLNLLRAVDLYANPTYLRLASHVGIARTYVLSAGWGLWSAPRFDRTGNGLRLGTFDHGSELSGRAEAEA